MEFYIYNLEQGLMKYADTIEEIYDFYCEAKIEPVYTAVGITYDSGSIDIAYINRHGKSSTWTVSSDFLQSPLYKHEKENLLNTIRMILEQFKISKSLLDEKLEIIVSM